LGVLSSAERASRGGNTPEENVHDARDGIYRDGSQQSMLALTKTAIGYTGALTLGVKV
jgi:hypothetical protein